LAALSKANPFLVPLMGGSGGGATGTFTITGGIVGDVAIVDPGAGYVIGDILTSTGIGSGSDFAFQVVTIGGAFDPIGYRYEKRLSRSDCWCYRYAP